MSAYIVVLDVFDGRQFGVLRVPIEAKSKDEAKKLAVHKVETEGFMMVKVKFAL